MASAAGSRASWMVAASVGAVEALKDQGGMCRWNHALRSLRRHAKSNMGWSFSFALQAAAVRASSGGITSTTRSRVQAPESEESLRKVMYLSCWGPN